MHVSSKEGLAEFEFKWKIAISCIIRKLYRSIIESCGGQGSIAQPIRRIFIFNRDTIPPGMREKGWSYRGRELVKYFSNFS